MQKLLVIQTAFIGDAVLATAMLEKLHQYYPEAQLDFLVRKGNEELFANHPFLNELLVWNKKTSKYKNLFTLLRRIRKSKYEVVINVQRFAATGWLTAFSGAKQKIGFDKNPLSFLFTKTIQHEINTLTLNIHEVDRNQLLIEDLTDRIAAKPRLYPSPGDFAAVIKFEQVAYVCIAPASVWFTKQYPVEKWASLIDKLPVWLTVYLLGAPGDISLCNQIQNLSSNPNLVSLAGKLTMLQSAALQMNAQMNYVNDSAPLHSASSVNAPVTAVYCSTVPSFGFGPLSDKHFIVQTPEVLPCKPCGLHGYNECPLGHFKCAKTIKDEQLLEVLQPQQNTSN